MKPGDRVTLKQLEIEHIRKVLESTEEKGQAAEWLGIDRGTLRKKIDKLGINYMKFSHPKPPETGPSSNEPPPPNPTSQSGDDDAETSTDD
jgi:hypothetical protein